MAETQAPLLPVPFAVIGDNGRVLYSGVSNVLPPASQGLVLEQQAPADSWWDGEAFQPIAAQPSAFHLFDWPSHTWVDQRTLEHRRLIAWAAVKDAREAFISSGVNLPVLGRFDADAAAALNITGTYAALDAMPADWQIQWTRFDNTAISLTKEQFRTMALAVLGHSANAHAISRALRDRINTAGSAADIDAVQWPT